MRKIIVYIAVLLLALAPVETVSAQDQTSDPIYIVQSGDTLYQIAAYFGVSAQDIIDANQLTSPDSLYEGMQLVIPGLVDVHGTLTTRIIQVGESLTSLSLRYGIPEAQLIQLNRVTSPNELYVGSSLILPLIEGLEKQITSVQLGTGQSLLEKSAASQVNPWKVVRFNEIAGQSTAIPYTNLFLPLAGDQQATSSISPDVSSVTVSPLPLIQGTTAVVTVKTTSAMDLSGSLNGMPLQFFPSGENEYVALQGVDAMVDPGLVQFSIRGNQNQAQKFSLDQMLLLQSAGFGEDPALTVDPATIDPAVTEPELQMIKGVVSVVSPDRLWSDVWREPVDQPSCYKSLYGNRRSYNGSDYIYFHTGLDYGVCSTLNIYAPAPGKVVFAGELTVRGNTVILDHGHGVFSAYFHQDQILVNTGDMLQTGDQIGIIGATGRVTGPHLHFEIWVNGVQVQPLDWLENVYP